MQRITIALVFLVGCASSEDPVAHDAELRQELSRVLEPPVAVVPNRDIGTSFDGQVESATQESDATYSPTAADCVMQHYESNGFIIAVYERCPGSHRRLFVFDAEGLWRAYGDFDDDARVDAWLDPDRGGLLIEDRNFDVAADTWTESFVRLDDFVIEGFEAGWIPPAYPAERILEDTDFDGTYDLETITGGKDPDGNATYWQKL